MSAYIKQLQRMAAASLPATPPLQKRFMDWYVSLPEVTRHRPFSMIEFEQALGTQGKYISPVLLKLGWQRKRRWSSQGQYHRYWVPPALACTKPSC
ncbi:hypothetical protein IQ288_05075 [Burkholderia sp. R-69980]|uniref:hypothetical protein n=1 Tax=Paraburkholderia domus TaxID=2793075 RepID=UPI001912B3DD|nr:hypothetical protein [Paraburkholderia domus]MBK5119247.1 hypothetical protein [Burkholderia sp. R-69980]CAE6864597.1 hypothetical protein R75471_00421 [Paraburkholderia domus]